MDSKRRKYLSIGAASMLSIPARALADTDDGVGPNRGIAEQQQKRKQACVNDAVPVSETTTRLSTPEDFGNGECQLIKDSHEGPFFTCTPAQGKDITFGRAGQPLTIALRLIDENCQPIPDGVVDIWACDAEGYYSGYSHNPDKLPPMVRAILFGHIKPDLEDRACRGALRTDADGIAEFDTIYPGYYYGQPIHVHFKAHVNGKNLLTSQANFTESWNERIMKLPPYNTPRPIERKIGDSSFPKMHVIERGDKLIGVLDLVVPA